jgi:hypothetical protein
MLFLFAARMQGVGVVCMGCAQKQLQPQKETSMAETYS